MKKLLTLILTFLLTLSLAAGSVACSETFVNPGDNLGGGGTGESATAVDATQEEEATEAAANTDLDDLQGDTDSSEAENATAEENAALLIESAGDYVLTGEYPQGVHITAAAKSDVHLYLNGATITAESGKALYSDNKITCTVTLVEGTVNTVTNGGDDVNAVHIKGDLSINGTGKLTVVSESKTAIKASKVLQIVDATLELTAAAHGISAETVIAKDCAITVLAAGKDGIQAESDATAFTLEDGYVSLKNVTYTANTSGDGIQADTFVYIDGGTYAITTTGAWVPYSAANIATYELETDDFRWAKSGSTYKKVASDEVSRYGVSSLYALTQGCKGIKVGEIEYEDADGNTVTVTEGDYYILIQSGDFTISATDDAIHTNSGNVTINGGTLSISTKDDGITADGLAKINDGEIDITYSYEGIEGAYVEINGGTVNVYATDDGINAASDDTSVVEHILITAGTVVVKSDGDGIDSNGSIQIDGGYVIVHGPTSGGDASLDADRGILINGGYLFATGSLGMVETPSTNSSQYVVSLATQSAVSANTTVSLKDSSGNVLMYVTTAKTCQSIILSCPELVKGSSYTITGGSSTLGSFTVSSVITSVGSTNSGTPGGPGGFGGRR